MKSWKSMNNRSNATAGRPDSATPPGWNRLLPRRRRHSVGSFCTHRFRQWRRRTFSISARTTRFIDGNKRVGANAAITFLRVNNWTPAFGEEELVDLVLSVASGTLNKAGLTEVFESRCAPLEGL